MSRDDWKDAALVVVGHGSTRNADSAAPVYQHAAGLRRRGLFAEVLEGFWKQEPFIGAVVRGVACRRIFVVPLFISEGYFTEEVIPRELGLRGPGEAAFDRTQTRGARTIHYCRPIGTHPRITDVILARAREAVNPRAPHPRPLPLHPMQGERVPEGPVRGPEYPETCLFLAGHGTPVNENSRVAIEQQVERIRARNLYREVHAVFMEEEPRISDCHQLSGAREFVVVPFFISDGMHSREDIPVLLGESAAEVERRLKAGEPAWRNPTERHGHRVWYARSVGTSPVVEEIVLERVREAEESATR